MREFRLNENILANTTKAEVKQRKKIGDELKEPIRPEGCEESQSGAEHTGRGRPPISRHEAAAAAV